VLQSTPGVVAAIIGTMLWLIVSTGAHSSVGGARPKALFDDDGRPLIAKFSSPTDTFPWMPAEAVAMKLARHGSYAELADVIRRQFVEPKDTLVELFSRIVFNVLLGNTDDHPRNHAAFGTGPTRPRPRLRHLYTTAIDGEAAQAMAIGRDG
jgi:serine/threonine-protein kinase HipA